MESAGYNEPVSRCYYCRGSDFKDHSLGTYWKEFGLRYVRCLGCGLIFVNPMPDRNTIQKGNMALSRFKKPEEAVRQYRGGKMFARRLRKIKKAGHLLDVGSGRGFFLLGVKENCAWKAEGVEIVRTLCEYAKTMLGITVHRGTVLDLSGKGERYDFIRMNNILEHAQDPFRFLKSVSALLKPGGLAYCSTPNGVQDGRVLITANRRGLSLNLLENHFFLYPPSMLRRMFKACGFIIRKHFCEDISHTLNDFGLLPRFQYPVHNQPIGLESVPETAPVEQKLSIKDIQALKHHPSVSDNRLALLEWRNALRVRIPPAIAFGHQQQLTAEKGAGSS